MKKYLPNFITGAVFFGLGVYFDDKIVHVARLVIPIAFFLIGFLIWKSTGKQELDKFK